MKTPEEIKKGLTCVCDTPDCEKCAYATKVNDDEFGEILQFHCSQIYEDAYDLICQLEQRLAQVERERDAAVFDLHGHCDYCKTGKNDCAKCVYYHYFHIEEPVEDLWQWRGVCEENSL